MRKSGLIEFYTKINIHAFLGFIEIAYEPASQHYQYFSNTIEAKPKAA
jgi:hypothetical protein